MVSQAGAAALLGWRNQNLRLYHGTLSANADSITRQGIDLSRSRNNVDFGRGFYTTTLWRQASAWALDKSDRLSVSQQTGTDNLPVVLEYSVERDALALLEILSFVRGTEDAEDFWGFVSYCRRQPPRDLGNHGRAIDKSDGKYDIVIGPVASIWRERSVFPDYDQISFHTTNAIGMLGDPVIIHPVPITNT